MKPSLLFFLLHAVAFSLAGPGKLFILPGLVQKLPLLEATCLPDPSHSQDSLRFVYSHLCIKRLCFVMVLVSESYPSAAEDLAASEEKLSEAFCAPALGT